jgi:DNA-binding NtrC family response regulator
MRGKGRVLFVDDDELLASAARVGLSRLGYEVITETEPKKALLTLTRDRNFDLVITDYAMPGMSGLVLAKELLKKQPRLPIILCTGFSAEVDEATTKKAGIRAFLMKPYTRAQLALAVTRVLHRTSKKREAEDNRESR